MTGTFTLETKPTGETVLLFRLDSTGHKVAILTTPDAPIVQGLRAAAKMTQEPA